MSTSTNMSEMKMKDLVSMNWIEEPGGIILRPDIQIHHADSHKISYTLDILNTLSNFAANDSDTWVLCGIKIFPVEGMPPPGSDNELESTHIFSVFLRKNNSNLFGIPGDFTMATLGSWSKFTWPLPISFLLSMQPEIFLERPITTSEYKKGLSFLPKPECQIYIRRVSDILNCNFIFTISNNFGVQPSKIVKVYHAEKGFIPLDYDYFEGGIQNGPFQTIPSWSLLEKGGQTDEF